MPIYSHSRLEAFRHCPRKYFFQYVARLELPDQPEQIATFLGSRVHEVLEHLYRRVSMGALPLLEELRRRLDEGWTAHWTSAVVIHDRDATPEDFRRLAWKCIENYHRRFQPFDQATVIGLEYKVTFPLDDAGRFMMTGNIDRIARTPDGRWQIHDYKTNNKLPTQAEKDKDPQLAFYEIALRHAWKDIDRVELVWHFLRFDHSIVSARTTEQLDCLRADTIALITDIERRGDQAADFPTSEGPLCSYCAFQQVCPARKHLHQVRVMPEKDLAAEPAVALVDRWTDLDERRKTLKRDLDDIEARIDEVREALLAIAARDDLELVAGRSREVSIATTDRIVFPRKGQEPEQAARLEAVLRDTPWWPRLSSLNAAELKAAWESTDTPPELRRLLEQFAWKEREVAARLRLRRD